MIQETITHACRACKSTRLVKNGTNRCGNARDRCKDCGAYRVLTPKPASWETDKQTVLRPGLERCRMLRVERIFDITRQTVARWFSTHIQKLSEGEDTLLPASPDDVLELDEGWSCVLNKAGARWVWTAMCRRRRHIVAFAVGDCEPCNMPSFMEGHPG